MSVAVNQNWVHDAEDEDARKEREQEEQAANHGHHQATLLKGCQRLLRLAQELNATVEKNLTTVVSNIASKLAEFLQDVEQAKEAALAGKGKDSEEFNETSKKLGDFPKLVAEAETAVLSLIEQLLLSEAQVNAIRNVKQEINSWNYASDPFNAIPPELEELLEAALCKMPEKIDDKDLRAHPKFKDFKDTMGSYLKNDGEEEEITMMGAGGADIPIKCGITQLELSKPLQSQKCKHIFSEDGIENLYKKKKSQMKCPKGGCMQMNFRYDFVRSEELDKKVLKAIKRQKRQQMLSQAATQHEIEEL